MVISPTFDFSRAISSSRSSRSRSFRAVAAPESARSRHSVSLATETFVSRATSSNGSPRNNRATTANLRLTEKRFGPFPSTPEGAPAPALGERSGAPSGLRPSSFVMSDTQVNAQSTSAWCLNYPCRTPRQGMHRCFGAIAPGVARGLKLRHDHGSNYMSGDFQDEIECLGIEASPSFVREPEGNGVAERFIRTLKENLLWVRTFDTIEELRAALIKFARHYNETWLVARHGYRTPAQVRADQCRLDQNAMADLKLAA